MTESDKQSNMSELILVDSFDNEIGHDTKQRCHFREPKLHRALSVFVINDAGEDTLGVVVSGTRFSRLGFVNAFYLAHPDSAGQFIKIKRTDANLAFRVRLQKDSLGVKSSAQLTGALKPQLDSAKALIGGCWRNYP